MLLQRQQPMMIVHQKYPLNVGPPPELLRENFLTPQEHFFVRTHGSIPEVNPAQYRLTVQGMVQYPLTLSLEDLRHKFPSTTVVATLQCAGLRRDELSAISPIKGEVPWGAEAISNAEWRGIPLRSLLQAAGVSIDIAAGHVAFSGLDQIQKDNEHFGFGGSIPLEKALSEEVLLAYEMNGKPLPPVHGFPIRVIVPGYIGARSVKWLSTITVQDHPSTNYFQARAYKLFPPHIHTIPSNENEGKMLGALPLNAVICEPREQAQLQAGSMLVRGYAITGNGEPLEQIDVSTNGGTTWTQARITEYQPPWSWCFWEAEIQLAPGLHQIMVRAQNTSKQSQPEDLHEVWNVKGYVNNACQRITIVVV